MFVRDVMSIRPLCVKKDARLKEIATFLVRNRIGGVPVVEETGRLVGIVSASDLQPTRDRAPAHRARTAADVMTWPVITLTEEDTVVQAARTLQSHGVKRAPVLREGVIVGIVTRSDLLRPYLRTDLEIQADVEEALLGDSLELRGDDVSVSVSKGVVRLEGRARHSQQRALAVQLARSVDGVIDVEDGLEVAMVRPTRADAGR